MRSRRAALAVALGIAALSWPSSALAGSSEQLPDLRMAKATNVLIDEDAGRYLLRFDALIENRGAGPFIVRGARDCASLSSCPEMTARQVVKMSDGSFRPQPVTGHARYDVGDGHNHWHVMDVETYELFPADLPPTPDNGYRGSKVGFCFFDTTAVDLSLPNSPDRRIFHESGCGRSDTLSIRVGLSVGWGDSYPWYLPRQWVNVTDVADGEYVLCSTADGLGQWRETREGNNQSWARLRLATKADGSADGKRRTVATIARGKGACANQLPAAPAETVAAASTRRAGLERPTPIFVDGLRAVACRIELSPADLALVHEVSGRLP
jgi:hypothetical protein